MIIPIATHWYALLQGNSEYEDISSAVNLPLSLMGDELKDANGI